MALSTAPNRGRLYTALGTGAVAVGALAYIGIGDPHSPGFVFWPCPFYAITGLYCPGCGGMRMVHDVLHGDLAAAVVDNVVALVGLPLLLAWYLVRRRSGKPWMTPVAAVVILGIALTWTVVRNLPGFPLVPTVLDG
ncbi:hypothetical protein BST36_14365 [Mycolicibacterium moriokaense]|jgi:hypothetical protein|uniref:Membrane protein n=1 Tax=Mycolicibacterium moriokaense TaxID=39691 RepID=A0AAD1M771_9MYCO|nr:DUF2752 domain-containing protein [Mycolicibacterium moriokaense]MCV7038623.1 DUF2752 domain-containing protein [Mycolicibacterium moriokaense]ORB22582.1 hypothetical protein BST36_14365 [Mycolicibacterium moriokaense]BBX02146.1 membrane protein [Mycolicibacterium moriokaense]